MLQVEPFVGLEQCQIWLLSGTAKKTPHSPVTTMSWISGRFFEFPSKNTVDAPVNEFTI